VEIFPKRSPGHPRYPLGAPAFWGALQDLFEKISWVPRAPAGTYGHPGDLFCRKNARAPPLSEAFLGGAKEIFLQRSPGPPRSPRGQAGGAPTPGKYLTELWINSLTIPPHSPQEGCRDTQRPAAASLLRLKYVVQWWNCGRKKRKGRVREKKHKTYLPVKQKTLSLLGNPFWYLWRR
jgi:hypothetical protein